MSEHATLAATNKSINPQKQRKGLSLLWHALGDSLTDSRSAWQETAFRQEAIAAAVLIPAAFWLGRNWIEVMVLVGTIVLILIVELPSVLLCARAWAAALFQRFVP